MPESVSSADAAREARARRLARRQGYVLRKDRARSFSVDHMGGYMVIDAAINGIVAGQRYDLSLGEVEDFLKDEEQKRV
jgi:hypothetical protein